MLNFCATRGPSPSLGRAGVPAKCGPDPDPADGRDVIGDGGASGAPSGKITAEDRSMRRHSTVPEHSLPTLIRTAFAGLKS